MKEYTKESIRTEFEYDVYYINSLNLAYLFPYFGYKLTNRIILDGNIVENGSLILFSSTNDLDVMKPNDMTYHRVGSWEDHEKHVEYMHKINSTFKFVE